MSIRIEMPKLDEEKMTAHIVALIGIYGEDVVGAAASVSKVAAELNNNN